MSSKIVVVVVVADVAEEGVDVGVSLWVWVVAAACVGVSSGRG